MLRNFTCFLFFLATAPLFAQEPLKNDLAPCGTRGVSDWLRGYQQRPPVQDRSEDTLWVALQAHLLAKDNGSGRIAPERFLESFCQLNTDFAPSNIQFYFKNDWDLLNETDWYTHSTIPAGIDMMLTNNAPDALNAYFVSDPASNCGYNLPYGGVAVAHSCSGANDHTWSHEVGHALSLPHPFIGWEGKIYSFNVPTPTWLTYDYTYFHDTLDTPPTPLDTALVELVDGSNCSQAADLICDSKPDYLSYRWDCDAQNMSPSKLKDPTGAEFYVDGSLYMSYALDHCQSRFTPEEINVMRATLLTEKANWLAPSVSLQPIEAQAEALEPIQDEVVPATGALFRWAPTPNATHYLVQASRFTNFVYKQVDLITTDTFLIAGALTPNQKYYWRIRPFNYRHTCMPFSELFTFKTAPISAASEPDADGWRCYPSLLADGRPLNMEVPESWQGVQAKCFVLDAAGRLVWQSDLNLQVGRVKVEMPSAQWAKGIYRFVLVSEKGTKQWSLVK